MVELTEFGMANKSSVLTESNAAVRLAQNGEFRGKGRFAKRRGIDTIVAITATFGEVKPFRIIPWRPVDTTYLMAVGSDAIGFVNPANGHFYVRTVAGGVYEDGEIWSGPTGLTTDLVASAWGLDAPTAIEADPTISLRLSTAMANERLEYKDGTHAYLYIQFDLWQEHFHVGTEVYLYAGQKTAGGAPLYASLRDNEIGEGPYEVTAVDFANDRVELLVTLATAADKYTHVIYATGVSWLGSGWYGYAATLWDEDRHVESQPLLVSSLVTVPDGASVAVTVTGDTGAPIPTQTFRFYRNQGGRITLPAARGAQGVSMFYNIAEETDVAVLDGIIQYIDYGRSAMGGVLTWANTVVPFCHHAHWFDGRVFYGEGNTVIYSNTACPETYAQTTDDGIDPILDFDAGGVVRGVAEIPVPADFGAITGFVSLRSNALILCEGGWWSIARLPQRVGYGLNRGTNDAGCVSEATIAYGQGGAWWLSAAGVCFWDGVNAPTVITRDLIDTEDSDTTFASVLSGASGAFDPVRGQYRVVVPDGDSGQFQLVLQTDRMPRELPISVWVAGASLPAIDGAGYDWTGRRIVYAFSDGASPATVAALCEKAATYIEGTEDDTFEFAVEPWWLETKSSTGETKHAASARLFVHRSDVTTAQTVSCVIQGLQTSEEATASTAVALVWAISVQEPKRIPAQPVLGRLVKMTLTNEDAKPLEYRLLQVGEEKDVTKAAGVR